MTKLVLIISNWSFVRDNKTNPRKIKCTSQDVTIGFKLASSSFRTAPPTDQKRQPYDFDKNGLVMPYPAFLSLMRNNEFTEGYIKKIKDHYARDTGDRLLRPDSSGASVTSKKASKPSAATLRRQYAEAFPELADSSVVAGTEKVKNRPKTKVKAVNADNISTGDSESSDSEEEEGKKRSKEADQSDDSNTDKEEEEEEAEIEEADEEEEEGEEEEEENEGEGKKRLLETKNAGENSKSTRKKATAAPKALKKSASPIKTNRRTVKPARKR